MTIILLGSQVLSVPSGTCWKIKSRRPKRPSRPLLTLGFPLRCTLGGEKLRSPEAGKILPED